VYKSDEKNKTPDLNIAEIDRVIDNLVKSGKFFGPGSRAGPGPAPPMMGGGRGYNESSMLGFDPDTTQHPSNRRP
jgi:hypothetical protein